MWKRKVAILLILGGLSVIAYPTLHDRYLEYQQQKLMEQWRASMQYVDDSGNEHLDNSAEASQSGKPASAKRIDLMKEMEGLLSITKINLHVPILTGVTDKNLNLALASIKDTGRPGEIGNYCIAGHRSRTYGVLFNRLDELTQGDKIVVETKGKTYVYAVTESMIVQPEEVQVLNGNGQKKQITLVTCDYRATPYLRLIIKGELLSST